MPVNNQVVCEECKLRYSPWDDEYVTQATKLSTPDALTATGWSHFNYYFCSASCLHKFSNPDTG